MVLNSVGLKANLRHLMLISQIWEIWVSHFQNIDYCVRACFKLPSIFRLCDSFVFVGSSLNPDVCHFTAIKEMLPSQCHRKANRVTLAASKKCRHLNNYLYITLKEKLFRIYSHRPMHACVHVYACVYWQMLFICWFS